jgi:hypothetical protein
MRRISLLTAVILIVALNGFGQAKRKKPSYTLPELGDEVLITVRQKQQPKTSARKRRTPKKYANQEVSYRTGPRRKRVRGVTHDPEFENWAQRKRKIKKQGENKQ